MTDDLKKALHRTTKNGNVPKNGPHQGIPFASRAILDALPVGCSFILREPEGIPCAGSNVQSFAARCGITVTTSKCFIVIPSTEETIIAVLVTRVEE